MIQGTCSNAGKSLLVTALCRILSKIGVRVAPFKAQNMSLNSFVTETQGEIGRAQALQAEACGLEPDVRMNPILLKPIEDCGSQLILLGKPAGMISATDYTRFRRDLWSVAQNSYQSLAKENDLMILEGAGSPAEINLRQHDIVNMRMARYAHANVFLTADIDRGGAFASLVGTMRLLTKSERSSVYGFILNKFRGNPDLLKPAIKKTSAITHKPFLGIVPWINNLDLPDEDSVSLKLRLRSGFNETPLVPQKPKKTHVDFAVIDLPHISNSTDFDALRIEPDIAVRFISSLEELGTPDCIIIPGTRNTHSDLEFLTTSGLKNAIITLGKRFLSTGQGMLIGICGGFQMLGSALYDPHRIEGQYLSSCLGFFPFSTEFLSTKIIRQNVGHTLPLFTRESLPLSGYEIHHGKTILSSPATYTIIAKDDSDQPLVYGLQDRNRSVRILGTYLHGIFDSDAFRQYICNTLRKEKGLPFRERTLYARGKELDRLANIVGKALPLTKILGMIKKDKMWF